MVRVLFLNDPAIRERAKMETIWKRISSWFEVNDPNFEPFPPGASEAKIQETERIIRVHFPSALRESYLVHDGTGDISAWFLNQYLLSLAEIAAKFTMMTGIIEAGIFANFPVSPTGPIKPVRWSRRWIPISDDGAGDYLCVDLDPDPGGEVGQVIKTNHEIGPERVLAKGFREFLSGFADDLETGKYKYVEDRESIVRIG
jgi:cell wall assembly regulator SMI1